MNPSRQPLPRLLLVEDDPVSAVFLRDAAAALPAEVDVAGSIAEALACAATRRHDLYLIDANLPDGRGETLLAQLRDRGNDSPALAHTAAGDAAAHSRLVAAGFVEVLVKPLGVTPLLTGLRRHVFTPPTCGKLPDWDDQAALAALGGQRLHVDAMRDLFLKELPAQRMRIEQAAAAGDEPRIRIELHRLAASCGFVGATRLADAVRRLRDDPLDAEALLQFETAADELQRSA